MSLTFLVTLTLLRRLWLLLSLLLWLLLSWRTVFRLLLVLAVLRVVWLLRRSVFTNHLALRQRLAVCAVQLRWRLTLVAPNGVSRNKGLSLRRDWCEDTLLREALTVAAAAVGGIKSRATNLGFC